MEVKQDKVLDGLRAALGGALLAEPQYLIMNLMDVSEKLEPVIGIPILEITAVIAGIITLIELLIQNKRKVVNN